LAGLAFGLLQSMVAPALPDLQRELGSSQNATTWVLTAYLLSGSIATPLIGRLGDIHGKQRMLVIVLAAFAAGTVVSALATSLGVMIAGRIVQGLAEGLFPLAFGIIRDEFPTHRVAGGLGAMSATIGAGAGGGVVLSGVIIDNLNYHWLFWLPLIAVVLAGVCAAVLIPESPVRAKAHIPWQPAVLLSAGLAGVLLGISQSATWGWTDIRTVGLLAIGLAALAAWVLAELRSRDPLVDMRVMRRRGVWTTNLTGFLLGVGMFSVTVLIPQLVELPKSTGFGVGASITGAGLFLLPLTVMLVLGGTVSGPLEHRFGSKLPLLAGTLSATAALMLLALEHSHRADIYVASGLLGIGIGLSFAAMANLIVIAVPQDQVGVATGMNTIARTAGGALGGQVAASILTSNLITGTAMPSEHGFVVAFWILTGALALASLAAISVPGRTAAAEEAALDLEASGVSGSGTPFGQGDGGPTIIDEAAAYRRRRGTADRTDERRAS
jgi:EmrB/QacA subfamily drug resistance transporter